MTKKSNSKPKSKKKQKGLDLIGLISHGVTALFALIAVLMIFAPSIFIKNGENAYTGMNVVFGLVTVKEGFMGSTVTSEYFAFSFMNLLTYLLALAGVACAVLSFLKIGVKYMPLITSAVLLVAGIFFFMQTQFCIPLDATTAQAGLANPEYITLGGTFPTKAFLGLGAGSIIGGIFSIISALAILTKPVWIYIKSKY